MPGFLREALELLADSGKTYIAVSPLGQDNVWTAVEKDNYSNIVVIKTPSGDDSSRPWPKFLHEMIMHELFKEYPTIRRQVDRIPPATDASSPPMLVLEILETTLWAARMERPFSRGETVAITKGILEGLQVVHAQGLVYVDLKMENIMLSGFNADVVSDGSQLTIKLGDLGTAMYPSKGTAQPVAYRAPEILFREEITQAADIWAVGLIYSHLVEAQNYFSETGLYDDMYFGCDMQERVHWICQAIANDFELRDVPYYQGCKLPLRDEKHPGGHHWARLRMRGLEELDVEFLKAIMKADPNARPSARAILASQWLAGGLLARQFQSLSVDGT